MPISNDNIIANNGSDRESSIPLLFHHHHPISQSKSLEFHSRQERLLREAREKYTSPKLVVYHDPDMPIPSSPSMSPTEPCIEKIYNPKIQEMIIDIPLQSNEKLYLNELHRIVLEYNGQDICESPKDIISWIKQNLIQYHQDKQKLTQSILQESHLRATLYSIRNRLLDIQISIQPNDNTDTVSDIVPSDDIYNEKACQDILQSIEKIQEFIVMNKNQNNNPDTEQTQYTSDLQSENSLLRQQVQSLQLDQILLFESSQELFISTFGHSALKKHSTPLDNLQDMIQESNDIPLSNPNEYTTLLQEEFKQALKDIRKGYEIALKKQVTEKFHYQSLYEESKKRNSQ